MGLLGPPLVVVGVLGPLVVGVLDTVEDVAGAPLVAVLVPPVVWVGVLGKLVAVVGLVGVVVGFPNIQNNCYTPPSSLIAISILY